MVQDPLETAADSSNGSTSTPAHVTAQVVVNTTHSGQHTLVDSDAASTSAGTIVSGSPHYITVTGNESKIKYKCNSNIKSIKNRSLFHLIAICTILMTNSITLQTITR